MKNNNFANLNLFDFLKKCRICPNLCEVNRKAGELGFCRTGCELKIAAAHLHFGEENILVGQRGSGTIFFSACNLRCVFCQNYDISQLDRGQIVSENDFINLLFSLQASKAANINLVSPTHQAPQIFEGLKKAKALGLSLPIVYNCGGYENPSFLKQLEGLVDIYMPDFKYGSNKAGVIYSGVKDYTTWCQKAIEEMHRQVGDLQLNSLGLAQKGLLIRHLVLPNGVAESKLIIDFIVEKISAHTVINIMNQYHPCFRADIFPELNRRAFRSEVEEVIIYAKNRGLKRIIF